MLLDRSTLDAALPLLQAQDHEPRFRDMVLAAVAQGAGPAVLQVGGTVGDVGGLLRVTCSDCQIGRPKSNIPPTESFTLNSGWVSEFQTFEFATI